MCAQYVSVDSEWCSTAPIPPNDGIRIGDRHVHVAVGAHAVLRQVADDLVERRVGEPVELDLRHRDEATHREPDRDADDRRLRQRRVETPSVAEGFGEPLGHPEDSAELRDVLAEDQDAVVVRHRVVQCPVDRLHHRQGWWLSAPG